LAYVHEQGIFHRDLKPSNVLMAPDGRPMLLDFNLSRQKQLPDDKAAGTIPYMPPELLAAVHPDNRNDSPILMDERSDLFSLGVILYELLAGAYPFGPVPRHENLKVIGARWFEKQKAGPIPLREKNPQVDVPVARLIESCLAFDPKARPRNARELLAMLRRQLSPWGRIRRWATLHRSLVAISLVLALAAAATTAYGLIPREPYPIRQLHQGWDSYKQGHYEEAIQHLNQSIGADSGSVEARYARGRAFQRGCLIESALADFEAADRLTQGQDGQIKACLGFSSSLLGLSERAIFYYQQSQDRHFVSAELLNNMAYSYMEWNSPTKLDNRLDRAEQLLSQSITLNDRLQAAYYNRARVAILRVGQNPRFVLRQGLADIRKAIELGPVSAPLFWDAARLSCLVAKEDPLQNVETFHYLNEAVDHGLDPRQLESDFLFSGIRKDARFEALRQKSCNPDRYQKAHRLVDPIQD